MGTWCRRFPPSIPAVVAQAGFPLLVLLAATAPSTHSATVGPRLQGAESATIGENATPGESTRTAETSLPEISPRPATSPRPKPQTTVSVFIASPKPSELTKPRDAGVGSTTSKEKSVESNVDTPNASAPKGHVPGGDGAEDGQVSEEHEEEEKADSEEEGELELPTKGIPKNGTESSTTATSRSPTPNDVTAAAAAPFATLALALCTNLITTS